MRRLWITFKPFACPALRYEPHCGLVRVRASAQGNSKGWAKRQLIERLLFDARWWCSSCTRASAGAAPRTSHYPEPVNEPVIEPIVPEAYAKATTGQVVQLAPQQPRCEIPADMPGPKDQSCKTFKAWANYAMAYHKRYGAWPVWNAKAGGQLGQLVARLGQVVCSPACAILDAPKSFGRARKSLAQIERREIKVRKEKLKSRADHLREAQAAVNEFIRMRDANPL